MVKNELQDIVEKYTGGDKELEPDYKLLLNDVSTIMPPRKASLRRLGENDAGRDFRDAQKFRR